MSEEEEIFECPLCMEEMDETDRSFLPCPCGYQVCLLCFNHILKELNAKCPACRTSYDQENYQSKEIQPFQTKKKKKDKAAGDKKAGGSQQSQSSQQQRNIAPNKRELNNVRVIQRNLVYMIGIPPALAKEELLRKKEFFGQYGKILKVVANKNQQYNTQGSTGPSFSAYVTYSRRDEALAAIQAVDGLMVEGRILRASFGTTKYCSYFLRGVQCVNPDCMYLHELGHDEDSFTKEEMMASKHQFQDIVNPMHQRGQRVIHNLSQGFPPPPPRMDANGKSIASSSYRPILANESKPVNSSGTSEDLEGDVTNGGNMNNGNTNNGHEDSNGTRLLSFATVASSPPLGPTKPTASPPLTSLGSAWGKTSIGSTDVSPLLSSALPSETEAMSSLSLTDDNTTDPWSGPAVLPSANLLPSSSTSTTTNTTTTTTTAPLIKKPGLPPLGKAQPSEPKENTKPTSSTASSSSEVLPQAQNDIEEAPYSEVFNRDYALGQSGQPQSLSSQGSSQGSPSLQPLLLAHPPPNVDMMNPSWLNPSLASSFALNPPQSSFPQQNFNFSSLATDWNDTSLGFGFSTLSNPPPFSVPDGSNDLTTTTTNSSSSSSNDNNGALSGIPGLPTFAPIEGFNPTSFSLDFCNLPPKSTRSRFQFAQSDAVSGSSAGSIPTTAAAAAAASMSTVNNTILGAASSRPGVIGGTNNTTTQAFGNINNFALEMQMNGVDAAGLSFLGSTIGNWTAAQQQQQQQLQQLQQQLQHQQQQQQQQLLQQQLQQHIMSAPIGTGAQDSLRALLPNVNVSFASGGLNAPTTAAATTTTNSNNSNIAPGLGVIGAADSFRNVGTAKPNGATSTFFDPAIIGGTRGLGQPFHGNTLVQAGQMFGNGDPISAFHLQQQQQQQQQQTMGMGFRQPGGPMFAQMPLQTTSANLVHLAALLGGGNNMGDIGMNTLMQQNTQIPTAVSTQQQQQQQLQSIDDTKAGELPNAGEEPVEQIEEPEDDENKTKFTKKKEKRVRTKKIPWG